MDKLVNQLRVRTYVLNASKEVPNFWPIRNFITRNPLYNLEHLDFKEALKLASKLFHAKSYLPKEYYAEYVEKGIIDKKELEKAIDTFIEKKDINPLFKNLFFNYLLSKKEIKLYKNLDLVKKVPKDMSFLIEELRKIHIEKSVDEEIYNYVDKIGKEKTLYEVIDDIFDTDIKESLNELLIKSLMDFLDEGQSLLEMPNRSMGLFKSWRELSKKNLRFKLRGSKFLNELLEKADSPEKMIIFIMRSLKVPEELWEDYFSIEIRDLHGFTGFIKWRSSEKDYYWQKAYPADLVDYVAIRLVLSYSLMEGKKSKIKIDFDYESIRDYILKNKERIFLKLERAKEKDINKYLAIKKERDITKNAIYLSEFLEFDNSLKERVKNDKSLIPYLLDALDKFNDEMYYIYLRSLENSYIKRLAISIKDNIEAPKENKNSDATFLFCLDVRSERFRRALEL